ATFIDFSGQFFGTQSGITSLSGQLCQSFSAIVNFKAIFSSNRQNNRFQLLDGIRSILSFWVLHNHEYYLSILPMHSNDSKVSRGIFNSPTYMIYLRIIPATMGAILVIFIYPLIGNVQFLQLVSKQLTILICITYISTDFQLYAVAPAVFLVIYHCPRLGVVWNVLAIMLGMFLCIMPRVIRGIAYILEMPFGESLWAGTRAMQAFYWRPDTHVITYMIGILLGYLIRRKPDLYLGGRVGETFLWIACPTISFASMYWTNHLFDSYYPLTYTELLLWLALSKPLFMMGWCWLCYACATGRGGFVNKFFGWKGFSITSNLSFEVCSLHVLVLLYRPAVSREHIIYTNYYLWTISMFDYVVTLLISGVFYVILSGPLANLVNILMGNMFESLTPEDWEQEKNRSVIYQRVDHINQTIDKLNRLKNITDKIRQTYEPIVQRLGSRLSEVLMEIDLPNDCMRSLITIMTGIKDQKRWVKPCIQRAVEEPYIGYDECLELKGPDSELNKPTFTGQYCWLGMTNTVFNERTYDEMGELINWTMINAWLEDRTAILDGIRTVLSFWVLYNHIAFLDFIPITSKSSSKSMAKKIFFSYSHFFYKNFHLIETFFCIAGKYTIFRQQWALYY
ncbi:unnamed protein product, partial [Medioppia subpectinata]